MKRSQKFQVPFDIYMFSVYFVTIETKIWQYSVRRRKVWYFLIWEEYGLFFLLNVCHSDTKPSRIDLQRIGAAKCHVLWIILPMPGFFTCTAGLTVDGVFQCHPCSVVVRYKKRLCEGQAGHLSNLTFHAKTFSSTWTLNSTLSSFSFSFFAKRTKKNAPKGVLVWKKIFFF